MLLFEAESASFKIQIHLKFLNVINWEQKETEQPPSMIWKSYKLNLLIKTYLGDMLNLITLTER
jgi:hypothetical protein